MKLDIVVYPDKRLKLQSKDVTEFDDVLHKFLDDMYDTMVSSNGLGLAAIQVANPINALIISIPDENDEQLRGNLLEIINPKITASRGSQFYQEGCLSIPGFYEDVERFETITIEYVDRYGNEHLLDANELLSIAVQHEMDHLHGKLFIEKLSYSRRKKFEKEYKKAQKAKKAS
ncbi:MAG: peptide deformylase [Campylobacterota bacterium]|nr:peptide deformylase [Campylobacterota bacterium]